jgi:hypothetical protein
MDNEGITPSLLNAFVVYLASHNRPMNELLAPTMHDLRAVYESEFQGMTLSTATCAQLEATREMLVRTVRSNLTAN